MDQRLRCIYSYHQLYVPNADQDLFQDYTIDAALDLPLYINNQWIQTLDLDVKV